MIKIMMIIKGFYLVLIITGLIEKIRSQPEGESLSPICTPYRLDNRSELITTSKGFKMFIDRLDNGISQILKKSRMHNEWIVDLLGSYLQEGKNVVHIGGHLGAQTLSLAQLIAERKIAHSQIFTFEPENYTFILLTKSVYINDFEEIVRTHKVGVGAKISQGEIAVKLSDTSQAEIIQAEATKRKAQFKYNVPILPLELNLLQQTPSDFQMPSQEQLFRTNLIYVNTNTMEIEVLGGMLQLLERTPQRSLVIVVVWNYAKNPHKDLQMLSKIVEKVNELKFSIHEALFEAGQKKIRDYKAIHNLKQLAKVKEGLILISGPEAILHHF